jgi:hypothetical protein
VEVFLAIWFLGMCMFLAVGMAHGTEGLPVLGALVLGYGVYFLGRWLARGEDEFLLQFLREALEAEDLPGVQSQRPA